jgi:hypothetical protein
VDFSAEMAVMIALNSFNLWSKHHVETTAITAKATVLQKIVA